MVWTFIVMSIIIRVCSRLFIDAVNLSDSNHVCTSALRASTVPSMTKFPGSVETKRIVSVSTPKLAASHIDAIDEQLLFIKQWLRLYINGKHWVRYHFSGRASRQLKFFCRVSRVSYDHTQYKSFTFSLWSSTYGIIVCKLPTIMLGIVCIVVIGCVFGANAVGFRNQGCCKCPVGPVSPRGGDLRSVFVAEHNKWRQKEGVRLPNVVSRMRSISILLNCFSHILFCWR